MCNADKIKFDPTVEDRQPELEPSDFYDYIVENCEWLEDNGTCSRYATEREESVWVCNECQERIDGPEHDCGNDWDDWAEDDEQSYQLYNTAPDEQDLSDGPLDFC